MITKSKIQNPNIKINSKSKCQIPKQKFCHLSFVLCVYFVICALLFVIGIRVCFAKPISSTELIEHTKEYDGKIVSFQGEVVGDIMKRGSFSWINIHDGQNAIGIWLANDLTKVITFAGGYKSTGDIVEVQGKFHRACIEHGGDLDIHADSLKVSQIGKIKSEEISLNKYKTNFILLGALLCLGILRLLKKKPKKR